MPRRKTAKPAPTFTPFWLRQGQTQPAAVPPPQTLARNQPPLYVPTITRGTQRAPMPVPGAPAPVHPGRGELGTPAPVHPRRGELGGTYQYPAATGQAGAQPSMARYFGRWGYAMGNVLTPGREPEPGREYVPPGQAGAVGAPPAGGGGGGGGGRGAAAPSGVNPQWYQEFQRQHGGQTPEQFYAQTGEGLAHALADKDWSEGFAQMYGRPPTDDDWRAHWFSTRVGYQPGEGGRGSAAWLKARKERRRAKKAGEQEQRPPTYMPPPIIWR